MAESEQKDKTATDGPPAWVRWVTRIALVAGAAGLAITVWLVGPRTIAGHLLEIGWWFAALFAVDALMTVCDAAAIHSLMRGPGAPSYPRVLVVMLAGRAVNAVTPSGNLGEPLKASLLAERSTGSNAVAAVLFMDIASACISLVVIAIGAPLTTFLLALPPAVDGLMLAAGALAAVAVVTLIVLVRRGMLVSLVHIAGQLRIISAKRRQKWGKKLKEIDARLQGTADPAGRRRATLFVLISKTLGWAATWLTVAAAGHWLTPAQLVALLSAGIVLAWISTIVPMGLGVAEGGNYGLFDLIGVAPALGVSLALARRLTQISAAVVGFSVLGISRLVDRRARRRKVRTPGRARARARARSRSRRALDRAPCRRSSASPRRARHAPRGP